MDSNSNTNSTNSKNSKNIIIIVLIVIIVLLCAYIAYNSIFVEKEVVIDNTENTDTNETNMPSVCNFVFNYQNGDNVSSIACSSINKIQLVSLSDTDKLDFSNVIAYSSTHGLKDEEQFTYSFNSNSMNIKFGQGDLLTINNLTKENVISVKDYISSQEDGLHIGILTNDGNFYDLYRYSNTLRVDQYDASNIIGIAVKTIKDTANDTSYQKFVVKTIDGQYYY